MAAKKRPALTVQRISDLADKAYRRAGYELITWNDGSTGVLRAPSKLIDVMNWFQAYLIEELGLGTVEEPPKCSACKRDIPFDSGTTCHRKRCQVRPAA